MIETKEDLFANTVTTESDCWEWQGRTDKDGYGRTHFGGKDRGVHRLVAMFIFDFDIESELLVCHHCDNPPCLNPDHIFVGTNQDNMDDMVRKGRSKISEATKLKLSIARIKKARTTHASKLNWNKVRRIRKMKGIKSSRQLANEYSVTKRVILLVWRNETWKEVMPSGSGRQL